jgi:hypothetical protein
VVCGAPRLVAVLAMVAGGGGCAVVGDAARGEAPCGMRIRHPGRRDRDSWWPADPLTPLPPGGDLLRSGVGVYSGDGCWC